jgi:hypothetical protein
VTACCAIFLVAAKRYAELRAPSGPGPTRATLGRYSMPIGGGGGQASEELILRDRMLLALGVTWRAIFLSGAYVGR